MAASKNKVQTTSLKQPTAASALANRETASSAVGTGTVSRALQLLTVLADSPGEVSIKYVADTMGLAPSTAHRLLQLLRKEGFVQTKHDTRHYGIGTEFYRVAARVVDSVKVPDVAREFVTRIAAKFDETVLFALYMPTQRGISFVARADGQQVLRYQIELHRPLSLIWGASGKAVLAFLPAEEVAIILSNEPPSPATGQSPPSLAELNQELQVIRENGYAVSESEKLPDARGIAAPVFGPDGVLGCLCLTSPKARMPHGSIEEIGREVAANARALSRVLGGTAG